MKVRRVGESEIEKGNEEEEESAYLKSLHLITEFGGTNKSMFGAPR
jgi:hypothetical protein